VILDEYQVNSGSWGRGESSASSGRALIHEQFLTTLSLDTNRADWKVQIGEPVLWEKGISHTTCNGAMQHCFQLDMPGPLRRAFTTKKAPTDALDVRANSEFGDCRRSILVILQAPRL